MIIPSYLPPKTEVVFVDGEGNEKPAFVIRGAAGGQFYLAFDDEEEHTTIAAYQAEDPQPGTFHFKRDEAPAKKKPFKPGAKTEPEPAVTNGKTAA